MSAPCLAQLARVNSTHSGSQLQVQPTSIFLLHQLQHFQQYAVSDANHIRFSLFTTLHTSPYFPNSVFAHSHLRGKLRVVAGATVTSDVQDVLCARCGLHGDPQMTLGGMVMLRHSAHSTARSPEVIVTLTPAADVAI